MPLQIGGDAEKKRDDLIGLVKYSDWRYEKEIRAFFPTYSSVLPDARVLEVELANLKGVIFGPRMSGENKARAVLCCHQLAESRSQSSEPPKEFQFFQAQQAIDRFDFRILPVGTLDKHYSARRLPLKSMSELDRDAAERIGTAARSIAASSSTK